MDRNTSHGRRNQSQSARSQKLRSRSRRRSSAQRSAGNTSTTATRRIAATRWDVRTQNRWPTIWLNDGTYITTPVTNSTSTAAATDQCSAFSVADAGVRVIAPSLPVADAGGLHDGDPAQPLDTFVAVVAGHDQPRGRSALRAERPLEAGATRAREASAERDEPDPAGEAGEEQPASYRLAQASRRRRRI